MHGRAFFGASVCLLLSTVGCQGQKGDPGPRGQQGEIGPAGTSPVVEGTRLYGRWEAGTDGSRRMIGWYDDQLKVPCSFARATDEIVRCLPLAEDDTNQSRIVFTSPDCESNPLLAYTTVCDNPDAIAPEYVRFRMANVCEGWHVRPVQESITPPGSLYGVNDGACQSFGVATLIFALGEEIPPSMFVQGGTSVE